MSWLFRRSTRSTRRPEPPPPESPKPVIHRSLALPLVVARLEAGDDHRILDLGSARGANIDFFSRFSCRLQIADLFGSLTADTNLAIRLREHPRAVFEEILPAAEGSGFHLVLAWDLLNYFERGQVRCLAELLARRCRPGAQLLAFIASTPQIPARPIGFKVVDRDNLYYEIHTPSQRSGPRYAPAEVQQMLAGFTVDRSFLLRHGIQEYLLLRDEPETAGDR